eukprot:908747-Lingulodinium_polyedra.AAC.1
MTTSIGWGRAATGPGGLPPSAPLEGCLLLLGGDLLGLSGLLPWRLGRRFGGRGCGTGLGLSTSPSREGSLPWFPNGGGLRLSRLLNRTSRTLSLFGSGRRSWPTRSNRTVRSIGDGGRLASRALRGGSVLM